MKMRILITGGAGCLGSNLIEYYLPKGNDICVIDNFVTGKREVVPEQDNLEVIEGSILNKELVSEVFKKFSPTHVIHSAASYKDPNDWIEDVNTNVIGTINVVNSSIDENVEKLVNFQTALCYGRPTEIPITINHLTNPFTSYGISKTAGESYLINSGLQTISLRLANICGPRLSIGPIPTFYKRLKENKDCFCSDTKRDFLDMSDFLSFMDIALSSDSKSGIYNISTGEGRTISEIFREVANHLNLNDAKAPLVPAGDDDIPEVVLDPSQTEKIFNWKAKVNFEQTIKNQLKWYDLYGVNNIYSHLSEPENLTRE